MPYVNSRAISRIEYDPRTRRMDIWFKQGGHSYQFCGVPQQVYDDFLRSASKGTYYDRHIKDRYPC